MAYSELAGEVVWWAGLAWGTWFRRSINREGPPPLESMSRVWMCVCIGSWIHRIVTLHYRSHYLCNFSLIHRNTLPIIESLAFTYQLLVVVDCWIVVGGVWYRSRLGDLELGPYHCVNWPIQNSNSSEITDPTMEGNSKGRGKLLGFWVLEVAKFSVIWEKTEKLIGGMDCGLKVAIIIINISIFYGVLLYYIATRKVCRSLFNNHAI